MIPYDSSLLGFGLILRVHGSALWKAFIPACFSTLLVILYVYTTGFDIHETSYKNTGAFVHPYVITAYITFFSFLLTFRLNYAYQRYWEGATAVFQMLSKFLDVANYCAAYHHQSAAYDKYRPPAFGKHEHLTNMTREREREDIVTEEQILYGIEQKKEQEERDKKSWWKLLPGTSRKKKESATPDSERSQSNNNSSSGRSTNNSSTARRIKKTISAHNPRRIPAPRNFHERFDLANKASMSESGRRYNLRRKSTRVAVPSDLKAAEPVHIPYPSLFLQETAHLVSLLAGVALSTLRNDIQDAPSPLVEYFPGEPLPPVNPDELAKEIRRDWDSENTILSSLYFVLGLTRDERHRTLYNAARPFQILGGISDLEIEQLQKAHGPYAKVSLCSMYVQEFVSRESMAGSTGKIPGPLLSRITHVLSDGMLGYNQARKLAYNPFPFPHAQMTSFFTIVVLFIFPLLYYSFVNNIYFACAMNFITVLCFLGIHDVARELENPYHNVPNDIPLTTFQAEFNEALVTIYSGFHPDSWWEVDRVKELKEVHSNEDDFRGPSVSFVEKDKVHPLMR